MEHDDLASVAGVFCDSATLEPGATIRLDEDAAHHVRVRRLDVGDRVHVANGAGTRAAGSIVRLGKKDVEVAIEDVARTPRAAVVHMIVPVADRDRMLWCAEKCTELGASSWLPVVWNRSRSVSPRGEGKAFGARVRARMASALVQSHGAWLPAARAEAPLDVALNDLPAEGTRLVLDRSGAPILLEEIGAPVTIAVGPEGGIEATELQLLRAAGFRAVSLGANVLRFETAAVAALAIVRTRLSASLETTNG